MTGARQLAVLVQHLNLDRLAQAQARVAPPDLCRHVVVLHRADVERVGDLFANTSAAFVKLVAEMRVKRL